MDNNNITNIIKHTMPVLFITDIIIILITRVNAPVNDQSPVFVYVYPHVTMSTELKTIKNNFVRILKCVN